MSNPLRCVHRCMLYLLANRASFCGVCSWSVRDTSPNHMLQLSLAPSATSRLKPLPCTRAGLYSAGEVQAAGPLHQDFSFRMACRLCSTARWVHRQLCLMHAQAFNQRSNLTKTAVPQAAAMTIYEHAACAATLSGPWQGIEQLQKRCVRMDRQWPLRTSCWLSDELTAESAQDPRGRSLQRHGEHMRWSCFRQPQLQQLIQTLPARDVLPQTSEVRCSTRGRRDSMQ